MTPQEKLTSAILALGLSTKAEFVPFSQSRNKGEKYPSLNWRVTVQRNGRDVLKCDYSAGSAHCPAYKASVRQLGGHHSIMRSKAVAWECEHGKQANVMESIQRITGSKPILPDTCDVIHSLVLDANVLDAPGFDYWAEEYGFDLDSRKAEAIYRQCLEYALALRAAIGETGLQQLQEAGRDY